MNENKRVSNKNSRSLQTVNRAESIDLPKLAFFGPKPLIEGENEQNFDDLWRQIRHAVAPADFIEEIWCRDVVDTLWDSLRLRRLKAKLLEAKRYQGLVKLLQLESMLPSSPDFHMLQKWVERDTGARTDVARKLNKRGLDASAIDAEALALNVDIFEKLDVMLMRAETRRHLIMQEMQRRKEFRSRMQQAVQIADGEFEDVTPHGAPR